MSTFPHTFRVRPLLILLVLLLASTVAACSSPGSSAPPATPSPTLGLPVISSAEVPTWSPPQLSESDVHPGPAQSALGAVPTPTSPPDTVIAPTYKWVTLILTSEGGQSQLEITPKDGFTNIIESDLRDPRMPKTVNETGIGTGEGHQINNSVRLNEDGTVSYIRSDGIRHFYARVFGENSSGEETWTLVPDDTAHDMAVMISFSQPHFKISVIVKGQEVDFQQDSLCPKNCELHFDLAPLSAALPTDQAERQFYAQGLNGFYQFSFPAGWHPIWSQ